MTNIEPSANEIVDQTYQLIDNTTISQEAATKVGKRYRKRFLHFAIDLFVLAGIVLILLISDLVSDASGWIMAIVIEMVFLGFAGLFLIIYLRIDPEKYGVSVLNYQIKTRNRNAKNNPTYNEIQADAIIDLDGKNGNMVFINTQSGKWQYRLKFKLSPIYESKEFADAVITKDGLLWETEAVDYAQLETGKFAMRIRYQNIDNDYTDISCKNYESAQQCLQMMNQIKPKN
ncbi:MAG: hypothetical protein PHC32_03715 [Candidatus Izemoplasmatales bacterium]|nr:hypothetical protein [Candidatus Izemoplasmatales bacterium]